MLEARHKQGKSLLLTLSVFTVPAIMVAVLVTDVTVAQTRDTCEPRASGASVRWCPTFLSLAFDPRLTMRSGAENVLTVHHGIAWMEDRAIGTRWFDETSFPGKGGGIMCRAGKYCLIDLPVDYFSVVFAHEFYGHGARCREFNCQEVSYWFGMPPPYGSGGGLTKWTYSLASVSTDEEIAIYVAGLGVQAVMQRALAMRWMAKRHINYREASLYLALYLGSFFYIQWTEDVLSANKRSHDIAGYLRLINGKAGFYSDNNLLMDVRELKTRNLVNLANPFLAYCLLTGFKTYVWDGNSSMGFPMLHVGQTCYLPSLRMGLTPFGPEYHLENFFRAKDKVILIDLHVGDQTFHGFWGGIDLVVSNIRVHDRLSLDVNMDLWKQPGVEIAHELTGLEGKGVGGAFSVRAYYDLGESRHKVWGFIELGYKSVGFLEGYPLDSSPVVMAGFSLNK